jgi:hypothetical protein
MANGQPNGSSSTSSSAAAPAPPQHPRGRRSSVTELLSRPPNVAPRLNTAQSSGAGAMAAGTGTAATTGTSAGSTGGGGGGGGIPLFSAATGRGTQRRRTSITTLGLSGSSPTQVAAFNPGPLPTMRRASTSSSQTSTSPNTENAVLEENEQESPESSSPVTPFARRVSFGTQAIRDRVGNRSGSTLSIHLPLRIIPKESTNMLGNYRRRLQLARSTPYPRRTGTIPQRLLPNVPTSAVRLAGKDSRPPPRSLRSYDGNVSATGSRARGTITAASAGPEEAATA